MTVVVSMSHVKKITQMGIIKVITAKSLKIQYNRRITRMRVRNQDMNLLAARSLINHALPKNHL